MIRDLSFLNGLRLMVNIGLLKILDAMRMDLHFILMNIVQTPIDIGRMITRAPGIKEGTPHIAGSAVTVRTIVRWYQLGLSPEEIAAEYPHLQLGQVYAALAYYHANREEMNAEMATEESESDRLEREHLRLSMNRK